ncbi:hypothetical protein IX317_001561 [Fusobacterium sp. DD29]|uniref:M48 family metallopeptidase n=1 Tax=unclassified Fusobacterium TaxID=2648384 RepID=UPI001B8B473B|nr:MULTISPECIES: SprT family zinc-dependent metalloprotease [unclassified Fusobacterium]MBR8700714.1 hypothetical protein [Fusobacterium sp. DD45]MBR8710446.1 hypothetical protein [Fusobacterium sp. DD28]MBR8749881.1 hypothetical protein [Fusobacterium sp. DD29]MBR8751004.1 hypothetical protein [Fusobacterium sp. DD26]MBR8762123.1 hypothetical protein [Fusobacterium sp. DD25]
MKNIILRIKDDGEIVVSAPYGISERYIQEFVNSKKNWIAKKLEVLAEKKKKETFELITGEIIRIFGREYTIEVFDLRPDDCKIEGDKLKIYSMNNSYEAKKKILEKFLFFKLTDLLTELNERIGKEIGYLPEKIKVRNMKSRWGSCNSSKRHINYNLQLYSKAVEAIEYVVLHELSHIPHPHHQKPFWDFVRKFMPDYKLRQEMLKE